MKDKYGDMTFLLEFSVDRSPIGKLLH
jgi:hypothetical protein